MGSKLSADDIYNINQSSLKDAMVIFGEGCTGEIVSDQGLIFTNHHCGFDAIQYHSSVSHDYLTQGFWASSKSQELPVPGLTVTFLVRIEDVTSKIIPQLDPNMLESNRDSAISRISHQLEQEATNNASYKAKVTDFYGGNSFYLFVYEEFKDVRLVGAPPTAIGKFGGESDNWIWPRQTGDFSIFRVYADTAGKPAVYSAANVPLRPRRHLSISLKGMEKNDFSLILGYPGSTQRYSTSFEIQEKADMDNPHRIKIREARQNIMMNDMMHDPDVRIKYADKFTKSANYYKFFIGEDKGIKDLNIIQKKKEAEESFTKWLDTVPDRKIKYGTAFTLVEDAITSRKEYHLANIYFEEALFNAEALTLPMQFLDLYRQLKAQKADTLNDLMKTYHDKAVKFFKDFNLSTDKKIAVAMIRLFDENVNADLHPDFITGIHKKYKGNYTKFVDKIYDHSLFTDTLKLFRFLKHPTAKAMEKDPLFRTNLSILHSYFNNYEITDTYDSRLNRGNRMYMAGILAMDSTALHYPDANFTMRYTYGKVGDYLPRDAVHYNYYTTLTGVMEKENPLSYEYAVPGKLKDLYKLKDYSRYGKNGEMRVCFTTDNDITGGNSGSPVMNGSGELVGLAFDGNWEAMSGDIVYEPELQKTICVDIRYVLFVIDKFAGAKNIINELTIIE